MKTEPILPPIQRDAHDRLVREAVLAERKRCAKVAKETVDVFDSSRNVGKAVAAEILKEPE